MTDHGPGSERVPGFFASGSLQKILRRRLVRIKINRIYGRARYCSNGSHVRADSFAGIQKLQDTTT
jgi:hypothetical protein